MDLLGCPADLYTSPMLLQELDASIAHGEGPYVIQFVNGNKVAKAHEDAEMRRLLWNADYVLVDGQPLVPMARMLGVRVPERIDGIGLMQALLGLANERHYRVYLLGATQATLEACVDVVRRRFPGVHIAGYRNGYFEPGDVPGIVAAINAATPDILFLGMASPMKERLADAWKGQVRASIIQGVGGSFDVMAGLVSRAPRWMQRAGLEWLYRVIQEPRRMFWRYAKTNGQCLWIFTRSWVRAHAPWAAHRPAAK